MDKILVFVIAILLSLFSCSTDADGLVEDNATSFEQKSKLSIGVHDVWVNSYNVPCFTIVQTNCLLVKFDQNNSSSPWEAFSDEIQGFKYEPGFIYKLKVRVSKNNNPPADVSSYKFKLVRVVSKKKVSTQPNISDLPNYSTSDATFKIMYINPNKENCVTIVPTQCLTVQFDALDSLKNWLLFSDPIEGFDYVEGFSYKIKVRIEKIPNPPADASNLRYILVEVIEKKPVSTNNNDNSDVSEEIELIINSTKGDCWLWTGQTFPCYLVKWGANNAISDWTTFGEPIEGFNWEKGFIYHIKVRKEKIENPPADASNLKYSLVQIIDKHQDPEFASDGKNEITLWVNSQPNLCIGEGGIYDCLGVKYNYNDPATQWQNFDNSIEGFKYVKGYIYQLKVYVEQIPNPPADGSDLKYTLVKIVSQTKV